MSSAGPPKAMKNSAFDVYVGGKDYGDTNMKLGPNGTIRGLLHTARSSQGALGVGPQQAMVSREGNNRPHAGHLRQRRPQEWNLNGRPFRHRSSVPL